jgi:hypothetical protein
MSLFAAQPRRGLRERRPAVRFSPQA